MWPQATTILLVIICCTSQGAGWFRAFFWQEQLSKIGVQKRPKSSGKIQGWQTAQFNRCLWRWQEDERARQSGHPESSQGQSDFCTVYSQMLYQLSYSRNGMWPQATTILLVIICCTSQGAGWFRRFLYTNLVELFLSKKKPPKSSRPTFSKVLLSEPSADSGTDRQDTRLTNSTVQQGWQTAQFNRCLWRWQEDERAGQSGHPESSQGPSDFCTVYSPMLYQLSYSRNGMWPQATTILLVIICCTSQGAGWFRAFFDKNNSTRLVYKNRLNHPAPHFPKYCPPSPLQTAVRTGKIQGWQTAAVWTSKIQGRQTAQLKRCLWRWQEDERSLSSAREHAACYAWTHWGLSPGPSACEADVIPLHHVPLSHCSHGVTQTKTCQVVSG